MTETSTNLNLEQFMPARLQRARIEVAKITKAKAASTAGVDAATWGRYENGSMYPPIGKIDAIARAVEVTPKMLFLSQEERLSYSNY